ncbi:hypothetical protein [Tenacibaculum mesophilum]|uniref:hypothetical protein n=1 Tax=Tenacibaculum mesophilum TaxID=104268 RepID=UPI00064B4F47|nr:hypothetical protein [Tenacibaculum mesophilum]
MKNFFSRLFNSKSNTSLIKKTEEEAKANTPEDRISSWLAHPNEYGVKPSKVEVIESGSFNFRFVPGNSEMKYSMVKYKMPNKEKEEIGIVDELSVWSFLNVIDYEGIDFEDLKLAYFGKLCEIMHIRLQESTGGLIDFSRIEEINKVQNLFKSKGIENEITEIYKFSDDVIFFIAKFTEDNGKVLFMPGHTNFRLNEYYMEKFIFPNDPFLEIALYGELGKIMTT